MPGHAGGGHSGHSSGGHSSSRSSGGGHSGSFGSSSRSSYSSSHSYNSYAIRNRYSRTGTRRGNIGCGMWMLILIIPLIPVLMMFYQMTTANSKLPSYMCTPVSSCVENHIDELVDDKGVEQIQNAVDVFYNKTGAQPYVILLPELNGTTIPEYYYVDSYLYDKYVDTFSSDEGHFILLVIYDGDTYSTWYIIGDDAYSVVGDSDCEDMLNHMDQSFSQTGDVAVVVSAALEYGADCIGQSTMSEISKVWEEVKDSDEYKEILSNQNMLFGSVIAVTTLIFVLTVFIVVIVVIRRAGKQRVSKPDTVIREEHRTEIKTEYKTENPRPKEKTKYPVQCPHCGATAYPNDDGTCQYCGGLVK